MAQQSNTRPVARVRIPAMDDPTTLSPGTVFGGDFTLRRRLGSGGMATVYEAVENGLGRLVAVKVLDRAGDPVLRARFFAEAKAMAAMVHPGVAGILRYGTDGKTGLPFLAMEKFDGSLAGRLTDCRTLPEAETARIALAVADALAALHAHDPPLVHRDLKPSNVLLSSGGRVVLADFGLVRRIASDATALTAPGAGQPGTWLYAAPEQRAGAPPSPAVDWYAFGVLLFRCLSGGFPGPGGELPRDTATEVSRAWRPLVRALLRDDPAERLCDGAAVRAALRRIVRSCRRRAWWRRRGRFLAAGAAAGAAIAAAATMLAKPKGTATETTGGAAAPTPAAMITAPEPAATAPAPAATAPAPAETDDDRFPGKEWTRGYADSLRATLAAAIENPSPDAENRIVVSAGSILLSGDVPLSSTPPDIVLDGGKLVFSPSSQDLRDIISRCELFVATAPDDTENIPQNVISVRKEWFANRILVTERGGSATDADCDIRAYVTNAVLRAPGTEDATINFFGLSSIVINRKRLDPGLTVTGSASVADFLPSGRFRNRRWFEEDNPL